MGRHLVQVLLILLDHESNVPASLVRLEALCSGSSSVPLRGRYAARQKAAFRHLQGVPHIDYSVSGSLAHGSGLRTTCAFV